MTLGKNLSTGRFNAAQTPHLWNAGAQKSSIRDNAVLLAW